MLVLVLGSPIEDRHKAPSPLPHFPLCLHREKPSRCKPWRSPRPSFTDPALVSLTQAGQQPAFAPPAILLVETAPPTHPLFSSRKEALHDQQHTPGPVSNSPTSSRLHGKPQPFKNNTAQNGRELHTISTPLLPSTGRCCSRVGTGGRVDEGRGPGALT